MAFEDDLHLVPSNWSTITLGELCDSGGGDIQTGPFGSQLHSADYVPVGVPSIMPTNISVEGIQAEGIARITFRDAERLQKYRVRDGDIVYSRRGDVEKCVLVTQNENGWLCGTGCLRVRLGRSSPVDSNFVHAYLSSPPVRAWVVRHSVGATMPNLNTSILRSLPIAVPPSDEMQDIGAIWASLIKKTNHLASTNQTLESIARAIFKSWFVDFDPVRGKAEGREPEGIDAATAALFSSVMEDTEKGEVPKGWSIKRLTDFIEINPSRTLPKGKEAPYLEMANAPTVGPRPAKWAARLPMSGCRFQNGDTLLAKITPCLENGKTAFVDFLGKDDIGWGSTEFVVLAPKGALPPVFGYLLARHSDFRAFAIQSMSGTSGRQRIQVDQLAKFEFPIADDAVYSAFAEIVEPLFAAISHNDDQGKTLAELRDTLLPRLISGKLRLLEAEKMVEAVL